MTNGKIRLPRIVVVYCRAMDIAVHSRTRPQYHHLSDRPRVQNGRNYALDWPLTPP